MKDVKEIKIVSGEGETGTVEIYTGKKTIKAIKTRLTKEKCKGDRWAYALLDGRKFDGENYIY